MPWVLLEARLEEPRNPKAALHGMPDCYKLKHGSYRLVYRVLDTTIVVMVMAVGKRKRLRLMTPLVIALTMIRRTLGSKPDRYSTRGDAGIPRFRALIVRAGTTGKVTRILAKAANLFGGLPRNIEKPRRTVWETSTESNWW